MKRRLIVMLIAAICMSSVLAHGQAPREDAIWARTASSAITLDGVLDEVFRPWRSHASAGPGRLQLPSHGKHRR